MSDERREPEPNEGARVGEPVPAAIRQEGGRTLGITWSDGLESRYPVRALRLACPCAHCVDELTGQKILNPNAVPDDVRPNRLEAVGRYAIRIRWSDGHDTGLYSFRLLRQLHPRPAADGSDAAAAEDAAAEDARGEDARGEDARGEDAGGAAPTERASQGARGTTPDSGGTVR